jgi:hypothetical protein
MVAGAEWERSTTEFVAVVSAWQSRAQSRDSMLDIFRRGEVLPEGQTNEEETRLVKAESGKLNSEGAKARSGLLTAWA